MIAALTVDSADKLSLEKISDDRVLLSHEIIPPFLTLLFKAKVVDVHLLIFSF